MMEIEIKVKVKERKKKYRRIEKFYQSLDGYVCLSAYEGFSLSTLEAMSLGVPVVSSSQNGVFFDARIKRPDLPLAEVKDIKDEKEATELVRKILCDIRFREEIIRSGLEITQSLSWKDVAQTYEQRYKAFKAS